MFAGFVIGLMPLIVRPATLDLLGSQSASADSPGHPWQVAAKRHRLGCWWGVTTDQQRFFVLVGRMVGHFGWEGEPAGQLADAEAVAIACETAERL